MKNIELADIELVIFNNKSCPPQYQEKYQMAYQTWHRNWSQYGAALGERRKLSSDNFTRAKDISALYYQGQCVAINIWSHKRKSAPGFNDDSHFHSWSKEQLSLLEKRIDDIVIILSGFTIDLNFRGKKTIQLAHEGHGHHMVSDWITLMMLYNCLIFGMNKACQFSASQSNLARKVSSRSVTIGGGEYLGDPSPYTFPNGAKVESQVIFWSKQEVLHHLAQYKVSPFLKKIYSRITNFSAPLEWASSLETSHTKVPS